MFSGWDSRHGWLAHHVGPLCRRASIPPEAARQLPVHPLRPLDAPQRPSGHGMPPEIAIK